MHGRAAREIPVITVLGGDGEDVAACLERGSHACRRQGGAADHARDVLHLRPGPGKVPFHVDRELASLPGFHVEEMDEARLLVDNRVRTRRCVADIEVVVTRDLLGLFRIEMIGEQIRCVIAIRDEIHRVADPHRVAVVAVGARQLLDRIVGEAHDPDRMRAAAPIMAPLARFIPLGDECRRDLFIGEALAVRRVGSGEGAWHRQLIRQATFERDTPELVV